jgi:hypothetical protein
MLLLSHGINFENAFNIYPVTYCICCAYMLHLYPTREYYYILGERGKLSALIAEGRGAS